MKKKIIIVGEKVHEVGYRPFLLGVAESLRIAHFFADNIFINKTQAVEILINDKDEKVKAFIETIKEKTPEDAVIDKIEVKDYNANVMKTESYYRFLSAMQLTKIANYGSKMLEKQDKTIEILGSVKEDTSVIREDTSAIRKDTSLLPYIKENTSILPSIKEDTTAIKKNTESMPEMFSRILSEIERIKTALIKAG